MGFFPHLRSLRGNLGSCFSNCCVSLHALSFGCRDTGEWQNWSTDPDAFGSLWKAQAQVLMRAELSSRCRRCLQIVPRAGLVPQPFLSPAVAQLLFPALLHAWWLGLSPVAASCSSIPYCTALGVMRELCLRCYQGIPDIHGVVPSILPSLWLGRLLSFFKQNIRNLIVPLTIQKHISNVLFGSQLSKNWIILMTSCFFIPPSRC